MEKIKVLKKLKNLNFLKNKKIKIPDRAERGFLAFGIFMSAALAIFLLVFNRTLLFVPLLLAALLCAPLFSRNKTALQAVFLMPVAVFFFLGTALIALMTPYGEYHILIGLVFSTIATSWGLWEAHHIKIREISLKLPYENIKTELKLLMIADLHLGLIHSASFIQSLADTIVKINPDVVVSCGDLVDGTHSDCADVGDILRGALKGCKAFAVTGNHEFYAGIDEAVSFTQRCGFTLLRGNFADVGDYRFAGIDDLGHLSSFKGDKKHVHSELRLLELASESKNNKKPKYIIFLKHRPVVKKSSLGLFNLQLSGHVHGGQIFPWSVITRAVYKYPSGLKVLECGSLLYVSKGTGTWGPPVRLFAPPEVTVIRISR